jgi:hypothetical protein
VRWRLWRKRKPPCRAAHDRADRAVELSLRQAAEAKERLAEAQGLAARFRELRKQNHFAEAFSRALRD